MKIHFLFLASTKGEDRVKSQFLTKFEGITVTISKIVIWQSLFTEQLKHKIVNRATCKTPSENPCQQYVHWLKSFATKASLKNMLICRHPTGSTRKVWVEIFFLSYSPPPKKKNFCIIFKLLILFWLFLPIVLCTGFLPTVLCTGFIRIRYTRPM